MSKAKLRGLMSWENPVLYLMLTATLSSLSDLCDGQVTGNDDGVLQRPQETYLGAYLSSEMLKIWNNDGVEAKSVAPTSSGSLAFDVNNRTGQQASARHSLDAKLQRLDPSVQCFNNSMALNVKLGRTPHFLVDGGEGPPVPLSQIPSHCGFSVQRSRRDLLFVAAYEGCHVNQQDGNYVLPLRLWGTPMTMSCPADAPPPPSVLCFNFGMLVKMTGVTVNYLQVKVSGMWEPLSSVCESCGFVVKALSEGLTLIAPYNMGPCVRIEDDEYVLSLHVANWELLLSCPLGLDSKTTTATTTLSTTPSTESGQFPQYYRFPMFPQYPVFPGFVPQTPHPIPDTDTEGQVLQHPMFQRPFHPSNMDGNTDSTTDSQEVHPAQLQHMVQYPLFQQYPVQNIYPRPTPPPKSPIATEHTAAPAVQIPQLPQFTIYPQYPMIPGIIHQTPPPASAKEPMNSEDAKPQVPLWLQLPVHSQYISVPFPRQHPQMTTVPTPKPKPQGPQPHPLYHPMYQVPVFYPPKHLVQRQSSQSPESPAAAHTHPAKTVQRPLYHPHPYMPMYYGPKQMPISAFPDPPAGVPQYVSQVSPGHPEHQKPYTNPAASKIAVEAPKQQYPFVPYGDSQQYRKWHVPYLPDSFPR